MIIVFTPLSTFAELKVGSAAPQFSLPNAEGKNVSLESFKGKTVVLEWTNFECPFVKKHYDPKVKNMQNLQRTATKDGVIWLSINSSGKGKQGHLTSDALNNKIKEHESNASDYLIDENGIVGKLYGARTTPHMFVIDALGIVRYAGAIDDTRSADPSDIPQSKNYVQQALAELNENKPVSVPVTEPYGCSVKYAL
jgi:peroxiredoxin